MAIEGIKTSTNSYSSSRSKDTKQRDIPVTKKDKSDTISLDKFERNTQKDEIKYERKQARKARKEKDNPPADITPPASTPPATAPDKPVETAPVKPTTPGSDPQTYAEKYVAIYEKNSGRTLTADQRAEKVQSVAAFYSDPSRSNRLETLVNGLSSAA